MGHVLGTASMHQTTSMSRPRFLPDNFILALIGTLVLASLLPCRGAAASAVSVTMLLRYSLD